MLSNSASKLFQMIRLKLEGQSAADTDLQLLLTLKNGLIRKDEIESM